MAGQSQTQTANMDQFEAFFKRADLDQDGRISGNEAVTFFQASNLPRQVLAQIWTIADPNRTGFLGRQEFYNALKLVTVAQSKRDLTPEMVKAALYGPTSARIPAPQINLSSLGHQSNVSLGAPVPSSSVSIPVAPSTVGVRGPQGFASQHSQVTRPTRPPAPSASFQSPQGVSTSSVPPHGGNMGVSHPPSSSGWSGSQVGVSSQANRSIGPLAQDGLTMVASRPPLSAQPASSKSIDLSVGGQVEVKDSKALTVTGNGHASDPLFGDVFSVSSIQTTQDSRKVMPSVSNSLVSSAMEPSSAGAQLPVSSAVLPSSAGAQLPVTSTTVPSSPGARLPVSSVSVSPSSSGIQSTIRPNALDSFQITPGRQPMGSQHHRQVHYPANLATSNQQFPVKASTAMPSVPINSAAGQSQLAWPRMTMSDVQQYSKVFMQVDTDRDGKIMGEQARNLFLSWRLPREVLKQVWDLSDQDNDSMLSLREFCIALYLMERFREGRPPPAALPSSILSDEALLSVSNQPATVHGNTVWRAPSAFQPHVTKGTRPSASAGLGKPPRPVPISAPDDAMEPSKQKPKVPELEKDLLDQLSTEEQNSLNSKLQEAKDAEKKVVELEKEITEAREKIQFYHAKMQELILYKSRCDNRLNEIIERVSADRREVELLAKKYEDKCRQAGDVASKLTIEEATFRDIQEKKMELYRAIVKLEQGGKPDGVQESANQIQLDLEELVKSLNERCKTYGLRAKPTSLVELPFGWQPGIQEGAADWDETWDKFEDEGYTFVKELTLDVQNVTAPPKPKASLVREKESPIDENGVAEKVNSTGEYLSDDEAANVQGDERTTNSSPKSPARGNAFESESREFEEAHFKKDVTFDGSPHSTSKDISYDGSPNATHRESLFSGDKRFDEPSWGTFDSKYDTDAAWDFTHTKDSDSERHDDSSLFGSDNWRLNPIKTSLTNVDNDMHSKQGVFFDSVPSTPMNQGAFFDSVPSTPMRQGAFFDSVPSTPMKQGSFFDSVPSTPMYPTGNMLSSDSMFQKKSPFAFADSVPSTPMHNSSNSPQRYSEVSEDRSFDSFSRFDSFNMHDGGLFAPSESSFSRLDSVRSGRDSEYDHGLFASRDIARFDSFRSTSDSDYNFGAMPPREPFARFDSMRSAADSDYNFGAVPPRETFARFDSIPHSSRDTDFGHGFSSFDDADPFGSHDPFKASVENQTPSRDSDSWKAF